MNHLEPFRTIWNPLEPFWTQWIKPDESLALLHLECDINNRIPNQNSNQNDNCIRTTRLNTPTLRGLLAFSRHYSPSPAFTCLQSPLIVFVPFLKFISNDHRPEIAAKFAQKSLQRSPSRSPQRSRQTLTNLSTFRFSFGSHASHCVRALSGDSVRPLCSHVCNWPRSPNDRALSKGLS